MPRWEREAALRRPGHLQVVACLSELPKGVVDQVVDGVDGYRERMERGLVKHDGQTEWGEAPI